MTTAPLRILVLEDRPEDAELVLRELRRAKLPVESRIASGESDFALALAEPWDVVLADYSLPGFNALRALELMRGRGIDTPLIVVTATLGDEAAAECIKRGAFDYILKDRPARLATAVVQAAEDHRLKAERAHVQGRLAESERQLGRLIERTRVLPYVWDPAADRFVSVGDHAARLLGFPPGDWLAPGFRERHLHPDDRAHILPLLGRGAGPAPDREAEYRMVGHDGGTIWVHDVMAWSAEPSAASLVHGFLIDISELRRRDHELAQAQKMEAIGQLTGGIAHDFNNLLTVIIGNTTLLKRRLGDDRDGVALATRTLEASAQGAALIRQMLVFSRRQALEPTALDPRATVSQMVTLLRRTLGDNIEIRFVAGGGVGLIYVDAVQLESALLNLAVNARDAMPGGGSLTIALGAETVGAAASGLDLAPGDYVVLSVTDTGTGMTASVRERAFEPFFTTKEIGRGTGLGLSMVFGFVKQSGGHVTLASELRRGTTVKLYLPRTRELTEMDESAADAFTDLPRGRESILLVEDNELVRAVVTMQLKELGYDVRSADTGATALRVIEGGAVIDLLFTDVVMPGGMSGPELAVAARRVRPGLKVLFTSGFTDADLTPQGLAPQGPATESVQLLNKPFTYADLAHAIRRAITPVAG